VEGEDMPGSSLEEVKAAYENFKIASAPAAAKAAVGN
jgi:hypothetical protein